MKNNDLTKSNDSKMTESKISKKSPTNKGSTTKVSDTKKDKSSKISAKNGRTVHDDNVTSNTSDYVGVTALIAIMEPVTESHEFSRKKLPLISCPSNKIKVLLDSGSDGDLYFLQKGTDKHFPYLKRQVPKSWHTSNGSFQTNGRAKLRVKFFEYSTSREYFIQPDVVEYKDPVDKPGFDLILGSNTMKELGIVLDFRTKEITLDELSLPMRNINKLSTRAQIEKSWSLNNSIFQESTKEPQSTLEATIRLIQILDAKYEKADLRAITENFTHLSDPDKQKLLEFLQEFEELFDGTLGDWDCEPVSLQLREGAKPYHGRPFTIPTKHMDITKKKSKDYVIWGYYSGKLTLNGLCQHL